MIIRTEFLLSVGDGFQQELCPRFLVPQAPIWVAHVIVRRVEPVLAEPGHLLSQLDRLLEEVDGLVVHSVHGIGLAERVVRRRQEAISSTPSRKALVLGRLEAQPTVFESCLGVPRGKSPHDLAGPERRPVELYGRALLCVYYLLAR